MTIRCTTTVTAKRKGKNNCFRVTWFSLQFYQHPFIAIVFSELKQIIYKKGKRPFLKTSHNNNNDSVLIGRSNNNLPSYLFNDTFKITKNKLKNNANK